MAQQNQNVMAMRRRNGPKLKMEDAIAFMNLVKVTLSRDHTQKYQQFVKVMKDFKARRIDVLRVRDRVEKIFSEHWNLYFGFDAFLPQGYKFFIDKNSRDSAEFRIGIDFELKILRQFKDGNSVYNSCVYNSFRDVLDLCKGRNTDMKHVRNEIVNLFQGHDDIVHEFICFAPYIINACIKGRC